MSPKKEAGGTRKSAMRNSKSNTNLGQASLAQSTGKLWEGREPKTPLSAKAWNKGGLSNSQYHQGKPAPKLLTLTNLKGLLKDLLQSKKSHDQKCMASGLPLETLEQHLYTFLTTRFGLKSLVVEWAESIVAGIAQHAAEDYTVAVIGKILQNEVDEDFRIVQTEIQRTLGELLKVFDGSHRFK